MRIKQEGLDKKSNNTSSFLQGVAPLNDNLTWSKTKREIGLHLFLIDFGGWIAQHK
jgi:hypothetical protein